MLFVRVFEPGRVILHGRGVRRLVRGAPRAKVVRLPVKPKVRLRRYLERHGKGRIRVEVTFKPTAGEPRTLEKPIVLRRTGRSGSSSHRVASRIASTSLQAEALLAGIDDEAALGRKVIERGAQARVRALEPSCA